jgi:aryl-alcohol dehydrogenase-like predicted oxidoreductase
MSLPVNQRKLDAAEALGQLAEEAGTSLIEMAIGFVLTHPAITSAIIGPRNPEQLASQLPAAVSTRSSPRYRHQPRRQQLRQPRPARRRKSPN